ncbi:MAG: hypothetical protein AMR96_06675 [Candidatus Adiutrix intracellularis]|nr:MAG: hypothetical protein AMR96_06675 [Candidatus Adiutrix intracellularis]MDR2826755.1 ATP-binding cassette domain-containing protein [Candidatus Adiutrix intracellularis]
MIQPRTIIAANNLNLSREGESLISNLSWRVVADEHWTILGNNGAGKTLLLKMLTGYIWPTLGTVEILGQTLGQGVDLRELRRSLGWVAKALEELIPPETTVLEVILSGPRATLGLYHKPVLRETETAEALAEEFGLAHLLKRHFGLLSSGEKQRSLLARAAAGEPAILFLDEPMANLDMASRELFMAQLEKLAHNHPAPTIILTTHNTLEIATFITHSLILKGGTVLAAGTLEEIIRPDILTRAFDLPLKVEKTQSGRYLTYL